MTIGGTARMTSASSTTVRPEPEERVADRQHREARQRAADVADVDREERAAVDVPEPDAERHARSPTEIATPIAPTFSVSSARCVRLGSPGSPGDRAVVADESNASTNSCIARS